jgi:hypothetical protein
MPNWDVSLTFLKIPINYGASKLAGQKYELPTFYCNHFVVSESEVYQNLIHFTERAISTGQVRFGLT